MTKSKALAKRGREPKQPRPDREKKQGFKTKGILVQPEGLNDIGLQMWQRVTDAVPDDLIQSVDAGALFGLCAWWSSFKEWFEIANKEHDTDAKARAQRAANVSWTNFKDACVQFGMTPKARQNIVMPEVDDDNDPFATYLRQMTNSRN